MGVDVKGDLEAARLRQLLDVGRSLVSELHVDQVLERVLAVARELTGARYAALGVLDTERLQLERFVTNGLDADTHRAIGELPRGRGILGAIIKDPRPLRLHELGDDPRAFGFPPGHPPMGSFLGVPILIRGQAWGNLYLTEKEGGRDFDDADEATAIVLATWAAIAIENAQLYTALDVRRSELERAVRGFQAAAAIATAVGAETDLGRVLELVVTRGQELAGARSVVVLLIEGVQLVVAAAAGENTGHHHPRPIDGTFVGAALRTATVRRIDEVSGEPLFDSAALGVPDARSGLLVPLVYRGRALGVLVAFDPVDGDRFDDDHEQVLMALAAGAATAVATARSAESGRVRAAIEGAESERTRWARELHDETLQSLGALRLLLAAAVRSEDSEQLRAAARDAAEQVSGEIANLRGIIAELRPASLDALGLAPALHTLAERLTTRAGIAIDCEIDVDHRPRLPTELETAIYRVAQEALTNIAKHARARRVALRLRRTDAEMVLTVRDDGIGFDAAQPTAGFGLIGIRERIALTGGQVSLASTAHGTTLEACFPVPAPAP
jgi:signal transduction histidine kinase